MHATVKWDSIKSVFIIYNQYSKSDKEFKYANLKDFWKSGYYLWGYYVVG